MRLCLMIFATLFCASCGGKPQVQTRLIVPAVPADLRTPVTVAERPVETLGDIGLVLTDHVRALDAANGKIVAVDCILGQAEDAAKEITQRQCDGPQ